MLPPVTFPPVIFCANAGVAKVTGPIAAATIPNAAITATAMKNSFVFIGVSSNVISYIRISLN
jgi:hypothetical protein